MLRETRHTAGGGSEAEGTVKQSGVRGFPLQLAGFKLIISSNVTELLTFSVVYCHLHLMFYTSHDL